ncbi:MAG: magnesium transporter [Lactimicrobium sp.]|uniref:magnesium transporter n=1 Tax=Lactimicrobium sp. TaxID=2563780 RepID=UPI002F350909
MAGAVKEKDNEMSAVQSIAQLVRSGLSPKVIKERLDDYHANDIADTLDILRPNERAILYRLMDVDSLSDVMEYSDDADKYLEEMNPRKASDILAHMEPDTAVDLLKNTDSRSKVVWLELMDEVHRNNIQRLASYDEDTIASRMTTNFVTLSSSLSIKEAMSSLVRQAEDHDNISQLYVVDEKGIYYGEIDLKELILARQDEKLEDIVVTEYPYVYADEKIEDCLEKLKDYSEESIPVLSDENRILGVITSQDVVEVVDDEMGDDYAKLAGLTAEEDLREPLKESVHKRLPWLVLLLVLGLFVSSVVGLFETVVAALPMIMSFQSMILDMSGNVGTQSLAVTIRVLMDEKLTGKDKLHLVLKEMRCGLVNGMILGALAFVGVGIFIVLFKHYTPAHGFAVSGCIGISLMVAMLISSAVGTVIPLFFKQIGVDPAVASGPLITTVTDLVGVVTYYGLAWLLLIETIHIA